MGYTSRNGSEYYWLTITQSGAINWPRCLKQSRALKLPARPNDGELAVELVSQLRPDVVIMDVHMPRMNGIQATRIIHQSFSDVRIIGFSFFEESGQYAAMRKSGAADCVSKDASFSVLLAAIRDCISSGR